MKFFRTIDDKFAEIGFAKIKDDEYAVQYERENFKHGYIQTVRISHKSDGRHLVQSYDKALFDTKTIGNTGVGLTSYEMKLVLKKMKRKGWRSK